MVRVCGLPGWVFEVCTGPLHPERQGTLIFCGTDKVVNPLECCVAN